MTDSNKPLRLPVDPFVTNSAEWWWRQNYQHYDGPQPDAIYRAYQLWMEEQGVIIRDIRSIASNDHGLDFIDRESMTLFVLRWG